MEANPKTSEAGEGSGARKRVETDNSSQQNGSAGTDRGGATQKNHRRRKHGRKKEDGESSTKPGTGRQRKAGPAEKNVTEEKDNGGGGGGGGEGKKKKKNKKKKPKEKVAETMEGRCDPGASDTPARETKNSKAQACCPGSRARNRGRRRMFEEYMAMKDVSDGLKRGELIQGALRINPKNYHEAYIPSPDGSADVFLDGMVARNRALNGDVVVVKLLPPDQWKVNGDDAEQTGGARQRQSDSTNPDVTIEAQYSEEEGEEDLRKRMEAVTLDRTAAEHGEQTTNRGSTSDRRVQRTGKVVYIVEQKHSRAASGFIKLVPDKPFALFCPSDHRVPRVNVPLSDCPPDFPSRPMDYGQTLFICRITGWSCNTTFADGRLVRSLGQAGVIEPETEAMLMEYDVDYSEFTEEVLECLPPAGSWTIPPEEILRRRDLRRECVFTIDPATARDLDDALSCKQLPDGNFEVGVHIADVSYFVQEGNALDSVASRRATSVYLIQKVIPMLPRLLCEELCSLNPQTDRLTFSVIWTLSPEGKILREWFGRSVIRSCIKLSYDHAQSLIDSPDKLFGADELPPLSPDHTLQRLHQAVLHLHAIAKHLRSQRFVGGALRLDQMKLSFTLDSETGNPQGCYIYHYRDSNKLVEEFMLLANMAVAHHIYRSNPELALLRRHAEPQSRLMEALQQLCDDIGLHIDLSSAGALHVSLEEAVGDDDYSTARKAVLTHLCARPMQMAVYFCAGVLKDEKLFRHYALNVPLYTHFTSPIRRYADIIVHRLLAASLGCGPRLYLMQDEVQKQASLCNDKKTASKRVQEMSSDLFFSLFIKECGPLDSDAMVMGMLDKSFDVLVLRYGVQKRIYCTAIEGLQSYSFRKIGKRPQMTLVWAPNEPEEETITQEISLFSVVEVQLKDGEVPLRYTAQLKKPAPP